MRIDHVGDRVQDSSIPKHGVVKVGSKGLLSASIHTLSTAVFIGLHWTRKSADAARQRSQIDLRVKSQKYS